MVSTASDPQPYDDELHARRATSFGSEAAAYAEHRPDYPDEAVLWALDPVGASATTRVLDLAAGTGKLTGSLVRMGVRPTAVEPDAAMLAQLRRVLPGVPTLSGTAEQIPLPDGAVDAVVVGQAFHWFDTARAIPEIARVLRPGGVLAALWNYDDAGVEWVAGFQSASRSRLRMPSQRATTTDLFTHDLPHDTLFHGMERARFSHSQHRTVESLLATISTHSHVLLLEPDEKARLLERVQAYLRSRPETAAGEFALPLLTTVYRTVRR